MKDDYKPRGLKRSLSFGKRFAMGWLLPVGLLISAIAIFNQSRPRTSGPEGGFEGLGHATATVIVLGVLCILYFIIVMFPFRSVRALIAVTLTPAIIGAVVIVLSQ